MCCGRVPLLIGRGVGTLVQREIKRDIKLGTG